MNGFDFQTYRTRSRGSRGSRRNTRLGRGCYILSKHLEDWLITIEWSKIYNLALYKYHQSCHENYYHYLVSQHTKGLFLLFDQTSSKLNTNMKEIINKFKIVIKIYIKSSPRRLGALCTSKHQQDNKYLWTMKEIIKLYKIIIPLCQISILD